MYWWSGLNYNAHISRNHETLTRLFNLITWSTTILYFVLCAYFKWSSQLYWHKPEYARCITFEFQPVWNHAAATNLFDGRPLLTLSLLLTIYVQSFAKATVSAGRIKNQSCHCSYEHSNSNWMCLWESFNCCVVNSYDRRREHTSRVTYIWWRTT